MKQHKWHKEIKAWADGAEIEERWISQNTEEDEWREAQTSPMWDCDGLEFRIKPQPKEPNIECNCYGDGNVYRGTRSSDSTIKTYTYPQDWLNKNPITQPKEPQCECGKYKQIVPNQTTIDAINEARKNKEEEYVYLYLTEKGDYVIEEAAQADIDTNGKWEYIGKIKLEDSE